MSPDELDLNLLRVLHTLLEEGSVTRAAARLRLTQSATSSALARLRVQLNDPLFTRTRQGIQPTPRAEALGEPIRAALQQITQALGEEVPFSPLKSEQTFKFIVTDHALRRLLPVFTDIVSREAPNARFEFTSVGPEADYERLRSGKADLMLSYLIVPPPASFKSTKLFTERHVLLVRKRHPRIKGKLTLNDFVGCDHIVIAPRGGWIHGPLDQSLAAKGLKRRVRMTIPHYLEAPGAVAQSDMIAAVPESVADEYTSTLPILKFDIPFDVKPFNVAMVWHERHQRDPSHRWMRERIKSASREF